MDQQYREKEICSSCKFVCNTSSKISSPQLHFPNKDYMGIDWLEDNSMVDQESYIHHFQHAYKQLRHPDSTLLPY